MRSKTTLLDMMSTLSQKGDNKKANSSCFALPNHNLLQAYVRVSWMHLDLLCQPTE
jgi:hypothetical protein